MNIELIKTNNSNHKNILVIGVFHGDESQGEYFIREYLKLNKKDFKNNIFFIPRLNSENTRVNKNGVDLNRNFPTKNWEESEKNEFYSGSSPSSEDETKFLVDLIDENKFDSIITIHAPFKIINYDGPAEKLAKKISEILNYPVQKDIGYPTKGSFGTYCGVERSIETITIEIDEEIEPSKLLDRFTSLFDYIHYEY